MRRPWPLPHRSACKLRAKTRAAVFRPRRNRNPKRNPKRNPNQRPTWPFRKHRRRKRDARPTKRLLQRQAHQRPLSPNWRLASSVCRSSKWPRCAKRQWKRATKSKSCVCTTDFAVCNKPLRAHRWLWRRWKRRWPEMTRLRKSPSASVYKERSICRASFEPMPRPVWEVRGSPVRSRPNWLFQVARPTIQKPAQANYKPSGPCGLSYQVVQTRPARFDLLARSLCP